MAVSAEKWSNELKTGITWQDHQHKELVTKLNKLYRSIMDSTDQVNIKETVQFLDKYVIDHFSLEEQYMNKYDYSGKDKHIKEHETFLTNYTILKDFYKNPSELSAITLCFELNQWIISHIKGTDKKLASFLQTKI